MIETFDDVMESIANEGGIYGPHEDGENESGRVCRACWIAATKQRILDAIEVDRKLAAPKCYCKPGRCMAPVIMGRQQPCLDPEKASQK